jgi:hypothetical protein
VADGTVLSRLPADCAPASRQPEAITIPAHEAQNYDGERKCSEVRIRAERQAGILLIEMKQNGRRERQGGDLKSKSRGTALMDLGISRDQSSKWHGDRGPRLALGYPGIDCRASCRETGQNSRKTEMIQNNSEHLALWNRRHWIGVSKGENHSWPEMSRLAAAETALGCAGRVRVVVRGHLWLAAPGRQGSCVVLDGPTLG